MQDPKNKVINQETKNLIDKLLLEKIPLSGIAVPCGARSDAHASHSHDFAQTHLAIASTSF